MPVQTYKTRLGLRAAVLVAAVFWAFVVVLLAQHTQVTFRTFISAAAFLVFFVAFSAHYDKFAITVTPDGLIFNWLWRRIPVRYDEIVKVEVHPSVAGTIYDVRTRRGPIRFSSMIANHRELVSTLVERSHLNRTR